LGKDVKSCWVDVGLKTIADDMSPLPTGGSLFDWAGGLQGIADAKAQSFLAAAGAWSVSRGLTVPLRSSIVRGGLSTGEAISKYSGYATVAILYGAIAHAYYNEITKCN
jgi:hypothetical protein